IGGLVVLVSALMSSSFGLAADILRITLDKATSLRLAKDAGTVMISNPKVLEAQMASPRLLLLRAVGVGESSLIVLDGDQQQVLSLPVVVVPEGQRFVSITRGCGGNSACSQFDEYSCAPRCVRVAAPDLPSGGGSGSAAGGATGGGGGGGGGAGGAPSGAEGGAAAGK
ncbi:MAG: pilus assembly protein N-terminal domain-containing protein, partial [Alphaproteobacteria bacterium]